MSDEEDQLELADLHPDPKLNHFAHFLFYLAISFFALGLIVVCVQLVDALSSMIGGSDFDMEPEGGWLRSVLIIAGVSFLIAIVHSIAFAVEAGRHPRKPTSTRHD